MAHEIQTAQEPQDGELSGKFVEVHGLVQVCGDTAGAKNMDGTRGFALWDIETKCYIVHTFDGLAVEAACDSLRSFTPPDAEAGGFDFFWTPAGPDALALDVVGVTAALNSKGYCVLQMGTSEDGRKRLGSRMRGYTGFTRPKQEFEEAYLGGRSGSKMMFVDEEDTTLNDILSEYTRSVEHLGELLVPLCTEYLGFKPWPGCTGTLLRTLCSTSKEKQDLGAGPLTASDVEDGQVGKYLDFVQRQRLCMMYLVDNDGGTLELIPKEDAGFEKVQLAVSPAKLVVFHHDLMSYSYKPQGEDWVVQSWLLEEPLSMSLQSFEGTQKGMEALIGGPDLPSHLQAHVMAAACYFPGSSRSPEAYHNVLHTCTDANVMIPLQRFDVESFYSTERGDPGKTVGKHAGMIEHDMITLFDPDYFDMSEAVVSCTAPGQRIAMERTRELFHRVGYDKKRYTGAPIAAITAEIGLDWDPFFGSNMTDSWIYASKDHSASTCNRICYHFGLTGPSANVDTACSSSLVANNLLYAYIRSLDGDVTEGLTLGAQTIHNVGQFVGLSGAGMLGPSGRCLVFDSSASGFARGEGSGGLYAKRTSDLNAVDERLAAQIGGFINQDGRSASLTAPNGPSQQACIRGSQRDAHMNSPDTTTINECHGTGTALGDPIEVGSCRAVFDKRNSPLPILSGKSHHGHLEGSAGSVGYVKTLMSLTYGTVPPQVHINFMNAHLDIAGFPGVFPIEVVTTGLENAVAGINGFGFGGTNCRTDFFIRARQGAFKAPGPLEQLDKLDCITMTCPKCLGPMCYICSQAISRINRDRHQCGTIRERYAKYELCSNCYQGDYDFGGASAYVPQDPKQAMYITGTWGALSSFEEMRKTAEGTYEYNIELGDTLMEQFQLALDRKGSRRIHPIVSTSDCKVRINGPSEDDNANSWLIDGRQDGVTSGCVYRIRFKTDYSCRSVDWGHTDGLPDEGGQQGRHVYSLVSSLSNWRFIDLSKHHIDPQLWYTTQRIGSTGSLEFQFVRDHDWSQAIYPEQVKTMNTSVPVLGPDTKGTGKNWLCQGRPGELVTFQLRVQDGNCAVLLHSKSRGESMWQSIQGLIRNVYYVTGDMNSWSFSAMQPDPAVQGVFRFVFTLGNSTMSDFQIVLNQDWNQRLYPAAQVAPPGTSFVCGPDAEGHEHNWRVVDIPGRSLEIRLDLNATDKRRVVICRPCTADVEAD